MGDEGGLDPVIHAAARLRVTATLAALGPGDGLLFTRLQSLLDLTAGNLTTHLRKLEEAGYIEIVRSGSGRTAASVVTLTPSGRRAFDEYSTSLRALLAANVPVGERGNES